MRIVVVSDTHRNERVLREIVLKHEKDAHMFLFAGDGERELSNVRDEFGSLTFHAVRGNCDFASTEKSSRVVMAGEVKILLTHGDHYGVKWGTQKLLTAAKENGARVAVFGHTHIAFSGYEDGVYLFNPGSASSPRAGRASYGMIDVTEAGIVPVVVEL